MNKEEIKRYMQEYRIIYNVDISPYDVACWIIDNKRKFIIEDLINIINTLK